MRRFRLLAFVSLVSVLALGASLAEAAPPASLPDGPDLSAMALTAGDLRQARVVKEGYEAEEGSVAAYTRTFSFPRSARLLAAADSISLLATGDEGRQYLGAVRQALRTPAARTQFARAFANGFLQGSGLRATSVTASRALSLGVGVDSLRIGIAFRTRVGRFHAVLALVRVDRALAVVVLVSQPGKTVAAADVARLGRLQRDRFRAGFTVANSSAPVLTGNAVQGQALTADRGRWSGGPTEFAYQWSRCDAAGTMCAPIDGAVSETYAVGPQDVGATLKVTVTARNPVSGAPAESATTAVVT